MTVISLTGSLENYNSGRASDGGYPIIYRLLAAVGGVLLVCFFLSSAQVEEGLSQEVSLADRPNMIFILADDLAEEDLKQLPELRDIVGGAGTSFDNAYVTYSLCCPSRASILRGQYPHNHQILGNTPPMGGHDKFRDAGLDRSTFATWLDDAGYQTAYIGKCLNRYGKTIRNTCRREGTSGSPS